MESKAVFFRGSYDVVLPIRKRWISIAMSDFAGGAESTATSPPNEEPKAGARLSNCEGFLRARGSSWSIITI